MTHRVDSRILWIAALGIVIGAAIAIESYRSPNTHGRDVDERSPPATSSVRQNDGQRVEDRDALSGASLDESLRDPEPQQRTREALPDDTSPSGLQLFVEARGLHLDPMVQSAMNELASEPRDRAWSAGVEGLFSSKISQAGLTLADWHVECRRSTCAVVLVYPAGSDGRGQLVDMRNRSVSNGHTRLAYDLDLLPGPIFGLSGNDGTSVRWHRYHRRCGPDWKCLERLEAGSSVSQ